MKQFSMEDSYELLSKYRLPFIKPSFIRKEEDALKLKNFPVVLKVDSPDIIHKTDVGGIILNVSSNEEAKEKSIELLSSLRKKFPEDTIYGIAAFPQVFGREIIIGMKRDPSFGLTMVFGIGGVFVNVLEDASLHVGVPSLADARKMVDSIKARVLLEGYRGSKKVNKNEIARLIVNTAKMCSSIPEIKELDFNPVIATSSGLKIADVRLLHD